MIKINTIKVGDVCKHFKGNSLLEKNLYEVIAMNVVYTGTDSNTSDISGLVIYKSLFQQDKYFAREYDDFTGELSQEERLRYGQKHRVERLTEEELAEMMAEEFKENKEDYIMRLKKQKSQLSF